MHSPGCSDWNPGAGGSSCLLPRVHGQPDSTDPALQGSEDGRCCPADGGQHGWRLWRGWGRDDRRAYNPVSSRTRALSLPRPPLLVPSLAAALLESLAVWKSEHRGLFRKSLVLQYSQCPYSLERETDRSRIAWEGEASVWDPLRCNC